MQSAQKWVKALVEVKLNKAFVLFCQMFGIFDDFSKFESSIGALYFEKASDLMCHKIWQKMKLALNPIILHRTSKA